VNRATARFILRFGIAESKGCAPPCHDVNDDADPAVDFVNFLGTPISRLAFAFSRLLLPSLLPFYASLR
jgi:hypothetical protein